MAFVSFLNVAVTSNLEKPAKQLLFQWIKEKYLQGHLVQLFASQALKNKISIRKDSYLGVGRITVTFTASPNFRPNAWICFVAP